MVLVRGYPCGFRGRRGNYNYFGDGRRSVMGDCPGVVMGWICSQ